MIFAGMSLFQQSAHPRFSSAYNNERVFSNKSIVSQFINDFDMRQSLLIGAYFILAFDYIDTAFTQDSPCLTRWAKYRSRTASWN